MLVLSRRVDEQIVLPDCGVTIRVLDIGKSKVRLGVTAPEGTSVHRIEVWQRIRGGQEVGAESEELLVPRAAGQDDAAGTCAPAAAANDLDVSLADWITRRVGAPIPSLAVETVGEGIIVSGCSG